MNSPWAKFALPSQAPAFAIGNSAEFRSTIRSVFGPLVERVDEWPEGAQAWMMVEVPAEGSLSIFFADLERRLERSGSLWVVFPKKPYVTELRFPFSWTDVQKAGLAAGLVDNKIAAFSARLTSIRFVVPVSRRTVVNREPETVSRTRERPRRTTTQAICNTRPAARLTAHRSRLAAHEEPRRS